MWRRSCVFSRQPCSRSPRWPGVPAAPKAPPARKPQSSSTIAATAGPLDDARSPRRQGPAPGEDEVGMAQTTATGRPRIGEKMRHGLIVGALGVVYGDIGTSPLYTVRQCFVDVDSVSEASVFGVLSLIAWALFVVVTLKYVIVIMRADNRGEAGLPAPTALALRTTSRHTRAYGLILAAGLIGAALFYGDGVITPAISVLRP